MQTILLTSIGSRSAIGVVESLACVRDQIRLVATNSNPKAAGNFLSDRTVLVPKTADVGAWLDAIARLIEQERPGAVLIGRDEELTLLAQLAEGRFPDTRFLLPPRAIASAFNDKYETSLFARRHGLPFAETAFAEDEVRDLVARKGLPLIAKLRRGGHASRSVFLVTTPAQLEGCLATGEHVFQELLALDSFGDTLANWAGHLGIPWKWSVDSDDHGVDMVLDGGTIVASCLSKGRAQGGMHVDVEITDNPAMRAALAAYAEAFGAQGHIGPLNLQGKLLPDGRYVPYELNARFVGTTSARTHLGVNLVVAALQHFGVVAAPAANGAVPMAVERNSLFMAYPRAALEDMLDRGEWRRDAKGSGPLAT